MYFVINIIFVVGHILYYTHDMDGTVQDEEACRAGICNLSMIKIELAIYTKIVMRSQNNLGKYFLGDEKSTSTAYGKTNKIDEIMQHRDDINYKKQHIIANSRLHTSSPFSNQTSNETEIKFTDVIQSQTCTVPWFIARIETLPMKPNA